MCTGRAVKERGGTVSVEDKSSVEGGEEEEGKVKEEEE